MTKADINAILMELSVLKNDMYHFRQDMERRVSRLERIEKGSGFLVVDLVSYVRDLVAHSRYRF